MEKFALNINSETFIWRKGEKGLVYNTANYQSFDFDNREKIKHVCDELDKLENLYTVIIDETDKQDPSLIKWIDRLVGIQSAVFEPYKSEENKPVSLKPVVKIQNDLDKIKAKQSYSEIVDCLREITIHLTGSDIAVEAQDYHKQFGYPVRTEKQLDYEALTNFLRFIPEKENVTLNFIGDFDAYPAIGNLGKLLAARNNTVRFYFRSETIRDVWNKIDPVIRKYDAVILCEINESLKEKINWVESHISGACYRFLVKSETEAEILEEVTDMVSLYEVVPVYTGTNESFFAEQVYLNKSDCEAIQSNKRNIFANQTLNTHFFGKLEIWPDGSVRDNPNFSKAGLIDTGFWELMLTVFHPDRAWFYNRKQQPCVRCLYQWLCPSPSNYELVMNKPNLCLIKE